jgi:hypothetical protein
MIRSGSRFTGGRQMRLATLTLASVLASVGDVVLGFSPSALAQHTASTKAASQEQKKLLERVDALTRQVQILEKRLEQAQQSTPARA